VGFSVLQRQNYKMIYIFDDIKCLTLIVIFFSSLFGSL
jgi:hypothetical protein